MDNRQNPPKCRKVKVLHEGGFFYVRKAIYEDTTTAASNRRNARNRKTHKEIERALGLEGDRPVHNLMKRERKKELKGIRKQRDRKPAKYCRNTSTKSD